MRKMFLLFFLTAALAANAAAQSGRRIINPPIPKEPVNEGPSKPQPERLPPAPVELRALPESILTRQLKSLDKATFSLADSGGKVVVCNLWASWCGPCRMEVPASQKVRK